MAGKVKNAKEPPLGLMPRYVWYQMRLFEVWGAITRYFEAGKAVPHEWLIEMNELLVLVNGRLERRENPIIKIDPPPLMKDEGDGYGG